MSARPAAQGPAPDWFVCPVCGSDVLVGALVCRECGADERVGWGPPDGADTGVAATTAAGVEIPDTYEEFGRLTRRSRLRRVATLVLVAAIVVALVLLAR